MYNDDDMYEDEFEEGYDGYDDYSVEDALSVLPLNENGIVPMEIVLGFSDIAQDDLKQIRPVWQGLSAAQRRIIMERLAEASEADYAIDYSMLATIGYDDPDQDVRLASLQAGWSDVTIETMHKLMDMAKHDPSPEVRAAAVSRLGIFIYMGEVEELDPNDTRQAEKLALELHHDKNEPLVVRRRALEAAAHATRSDVKDMINAAYADSELLMRVSAINAMGNTADTVWADTVLKEMDSEYPEMKFEAVRAAGGLNLKQAVKKLGEYAVDDSDRQIQEAAVWSLGEIGGDNAVNVLERLMDVAFDNQDDEMMEAIEDALGMAEIMSGLELDGDFVMVAYEDDDDYDDFDDDDYEDDED